MTTARSREELFREALRETENLRKQNAELSRLWAKDFRQVASIKSEATQLRTVVSAHQRALAEGGSVVNQRVHDMYTDIRTVEVECSRLEKALLELDSQCADLSASNATLRNRLRRINEEKEVLCQQLEVYLTEVRGRGETMVQQLASLQNEFNEIDHENAVLCRFYSN